MDDDQEAELRNPFPSPPSHYANYTSRNLKLLALLRERTASSTDPPPNQRDVLSDQPDVPEWPLTELEPPRVDWIREEGHYNIFGDTWFLKETIPSLAEMGGHQLYPEDLAVDRRPALLSILRSMLLTYSSMLKSMLVAPSINATEPPAWQREVEWITVLAQNIMAAANDLRPVQARASLELMMQRQVQMRRQETKAIHEKCDTLEVQLAELRKATQDIQQAEYAKAQGAESEVKIEDVLRWAEEI
ncbi:hypothetical protein FA95DRAFT_814199 [Auriscalpium vulgare]|uniref:Uncharacterized protein n=1 Tax=Auriscalpium vulgare TaxID=40419 RepID=A0ACB8RAL0_9AGAM|nr:hypothetical protein FA95DRAFT_814199 [Auriscalpium vulgare]